MPSNFLQQKYKRQNNGASILQSLPLNNYFADIRSCSPTKISISLWSILIYKLNDWTLDCVHKWHAHKTIGCIISFIFPNHVSIFVLFMKKRLTCAAEERRKMPNLVMDYTNCRESLFCLLFWSNLSLSQNSM